MLNRRMKMKMTRSDAEYYLQRKGRINTMKAVKLSAKEKTARINKQIKALKEQHMTKLVKKKLSRREEAEVKEVMKRGKIYGDPLVELGDIE